MPHSHSVLYAILHNRRPRRPKGLGDATWALVEECSARDPARRPRVAQVMVELEKISPSPPWVPLPEWDFYFIARARSLLAKTLIDDP